jgi:hypothetical protein
MDIQLSWSVLPTRLRSDPPWPAGLSCSGAELGRMIVVEANMFALVLPRQPKTFSHWHERATDV